jgi:pimeloyl-ACP methyl ester carboxylesterase
MAISRFFRKKIIFFGIVILLLLIPYFALNEESKTLDNKTRHDLPGQFIKLSDGYVHFELSGPEKGPLVVLIHGITSYYFLWDDLCQSLLREGFKVLRYDLYGRGFSDRPDVNYNEQLFVRQLLELLSALEIKEPVDLVGSTMGGAIAVIIAANNPEKVKKIVLINPAGYPSNFPLAGRIVRLPVVGDYLTYAFGNVLIRNSLRGYFYKLYRFPQFFEKYNEQSKYIGFKRAILSTLRNFNLDDQKTSYETVGKQKRQVMLIWGMEDKIYPLGNSEKVRATIPDTEFYALDGTGHIPNYEAPERVNPIIVEFLKR